MNDFFFSLQLRNGGIAKQHILEQNINRCYEQRADDKRARQVALRGVYSSRNIRRRIPAGISKADVDHRYGKTGTADLFVPGWAKIKCVRLLGGKNKRNGNEYDDDNNLHKGKQVLKPAAVFQRETVHRTIDQNNSHHAQSCVLKSERRQIFNKSNCRQRYRRRKPHHKASPRSRIAGKRMKLPREINIVAA